MSQPNIIALDPGPTQTAMLVFDPVKRAIIPGSAKILPNEQCLSRLFDIKCEGYGELLAVEWIESYGMAVGKEVFETCYWVGRFAQAFYGECRLVPRREVKLALCNSTRATDANVRTAIIDMYGGKDKAIGTKKQPGPLYGIKSHLWSALAVAMTASVRNDK